jgi:hypothetical protein
MARKFNASIGARLKHYYVSPEMIRVQLSGKGWVNIETFSAEKALCDLSPEALQRVVNSFEVIPA